MTDIESIVAAEAIKVLKARYCRFLDKKEWQRWGDLYTADATVGMDSGEGQVRGILAGRDNIVRGVREQIGHAVTVHRVYGPEIEVLGPQRAKGVWAMDDQVIFPAGANAPFQSLHGFGHYREEYGLEEGRWRIATLRLSRLREDIVPNPTRV